MKKVTSEEIAVTKSAQVLGTQFAGVLAFPHVTEYLDKEVEESFVNRSLRVSASVPPSLKNYKLEQMKQTSSRA